MRYLYGASDEKFVKEKDNHNGEAPHPLSSYEFRLQAMIAGKSQDFDKQDVPIVFKCTPDKLLNLCVKVVDALPLPSVYEWDIVDICKWLREYGYRQYQNTFRRNLIIGRTFLLLDASALSAMNIKDFNHIKHIAYGIRSLFNFEMTKFGHSISHYPEWHNELYKLFRVKTGAKFEKVSRSDLWQKLQIIRQKEPNYSHWELLERWLAFDKNAKLPEYFGGLHRFNMYRCKEKTTESPINAKHPNQCFCLPPCECYWTESDRRAPWRFKCLPHLLPDKEFVEKCESCIPPCTCRWTSKKYMTRSVLTCLQQAFPQKYGPSYGQSWQRARKADSMQSYRLSLM